PPQRHPRISDEDRRRNHRQNRRDEMTPAAGNWAGSSISDPEATLNTVGDSIMFSRSGRFWRFGFRHMRLRRLMWSRFHGDAHLAVLDTQCAILSLYCMEIS